MTNKSKDNPTPYKKILSLLHKDIYSLIIGPYGFLRSCQECKLALNNNCEKMCDDCKKKSLQQRRAKII